MQTTNRVIGGELASAVGQYRATRRGNNGKDAILGNEESVTYSIDYIGHSSNPTLSAILESITYKLAHSSSCNGVPQVFCQQIPALGTEPNGLWLSAGLPAESLVESGKFYPKPATRPAAVVKTRTGGSSFSNLLSLSRYPARPDDFSLMPARRVVNHIPFALVE